MRGNDARDEQLLCGSETADAEDGAPHLARMCTDWPLRTGGMRRFSGRGSQSTAPSARRITTLNSTSLFAAARESVMLALQVGYVFSFVDIRNPEVGVHVPSSGQEPTMTAVSPQNVSTVASNVRRTGSEGAGGNCGAATGGPVAVGGVPTEWP